MPKELHDDVYDAALDKIATCVNLNFCGTEPMVFANIATYTLCTTDTPLVAGNGNGAYTITNGATGRKVTVAAQTGMDPTFDGTINWATLDDGVTMLAKTSVSPTAVTTTQIWNSEPFSIELADPSA